MHSYRHDSFAALRHLLMGLLTCTACGAFAADWRERPYAYRVIDQDVRGVLSEFGRNLDMPVIVSRQVDGKVHGDIGAATAGEFLARVASSNALLWYRDGSALIIDREADIGSRSYDVRALDADNVRHALADLAVDASPQITRRFNGDGLLTVSGPPGYLDRVQQRLDALRPVARSAGPARSESGVRVFRGGAQTEVVSDRR